MRRIRRLNIRTLPRGAFKALCAFTLALCTVLIFDARLRPAVRNIAMTRAKSLAVRTVGSSTEKFISENPEDCAALVSVSGSGGKVNSMSLNAASVNLFKSRLVRAVDEALEENARFTVKIPLGSVTGSEVFAGAGPEIPVTVRMTGGASAQITDEFTSAGINQTRYRVMLRVECSVYVFLGGDEGAAEFSDEYCIAENIVIGSVPQTAVTIDIPQRQ